MLKATRRINQIVTQTRAKSSSAMESSLYPPVGFYKPNALKGLYYGSNIVSQKLLSCLPTSSSKAFIITGSSLATKTPLIKDLESLLSTQHAGTFSNIKQHAPVADLDNATDKVLADSSIDTIISVGGGSPIDSAKAISYRVNEKSGHFLTHIAIPTTLSAAEGTALAGYTNPDGVKTGISAPEVYPAYIFYDSTFALHTPPHLFASTGIRALDHAVEAQYSPTATHITKQLCLAAIRELFEFLPKYHDNPKDEDVILRCFLAAYMSLGFLGGNMKGGLGLSHTLGYALGSPYNIPHGITSCLTLGDVVKLKARTEAGNLLPVLDVLGEKRTGDDVADAAKVGDRINHLVEQLGFKTTLTEKGVGKDELGTILKRATGGLSEKEGKSDAEQRQVDALKTLVERLY